MGAISFSMLFYNSLETFDPSILNSITGILTVTMYDLDVVSDVVPDVVPHLNGLPSKQFKARIRCGGAANYGPRITEYIAEYYRVFNTAHMRIWLIVEYRWLMVNSGVVV